jgi:hypothetical protein
MVTGCTFFRPCPNGGYTAISVVLVLEREGRSLFDNKVQFYSEILYLYQANQIFLKKGEGIVDKQEYTKAKITHHSSFITPHFKTCFKARRAA